MFNWIQFWRVPGTFLLVPDAGNLVCAPVLVTFGRVKRRTIFHKNCFRPGFDYFSLDPSTSFCKTAKNPQNTGVQFSLLLRNTSTARLGILRLVSAMHTLSALSLGFRRSDFCNGDYRRPAGPLFIFQRFAVQITLLRMLDRLS